MIVNFIPRGLDEDINTPHNKIIQELTLSEYSELKTHSKVYGFAEKHYEKAQEVKPEVGDGNTPKARKPRSQAVAEQEQVEQGVASFDPDTQKDVGEAHQHKVYRKFDKSVVKLPPVLELSAEKYMQEHNKAVNRLMEHASVSQGDPNLKIYDDIMRALLKMLDHRDYINDYLTIKQNRQDIEFNKSELKKDALYDKKEKKHRRKIEEDYKVIVGEIDGMEVGKPSQEILKDINAITDFAVNQSGNNVSEMNKEQKKFFTDILKPMEQKIAKHENKGINLRNPDGSLDAGKLGQLYIDTKKEAIEKQLKKSKRKENSLSM